MRTVKTSSKLRNYLLIALLLLSPQSLVLAEQLTQDDIDAIYGNTIFFDGNDSCSTSQYSASTLSTFGSIYLIGDSITERSISDFNNLFGESININSKVGRNSGAATSVVQENTAAVSVAKVVVVALGTNDGGANITNNINSTVSAIKDINASASVYWVDVAALQERDDLNQVNVSIYNNAGAGSYSVISWFNTVFPGQPPTKEHTDLVDSSGYIDTGDGLAVHPVVGEGTAAFASTIFSRVSGATTQGTSGITSSALPPSTIESFNSIIKPRIDILEGDYKAAGEILGIPWEFIAAIHHRESGNNPDTSIGSGEPLGETNPDTGLPWPSDNVKNYVEVLTSVTLAHAKNVYGIELGLDNPIEDYAYALLTHNRGGAYHDVPESEGGEWSYMKSPYVVSGISQEKLSGIMRFPNEGYWPNWSGPEGPDPYNSAWKYSWGAPPNSRGKLTTSGGIGALTVFMMLMGKTVNTSGECVNGLAGVAGSVNYGPNPNVVLNNTEITSLSQCPGGLREGLLILKQYVLSQPQWSPPAEIGSSYNCRYVRGLEAGKVISLHATGRALDIYLDVDIPFEKEIGDSIRDWLILNSTALGVQRVIWNREKWTSPGGGLSEYTGKNAHNTHIHAELNLEGAAAETSFFLTGGAS